MVPHDRTRPEQVPLMHHEPPRQYADGSLEHAHMDVHLEAVYILALQERRGKGDQRRIVGAQKLSHESKVKDRVARLSSRLTEP